jgi:hypothetical protein
MSVDASRPNNRVHYYNRSLAIQHHCRLSFRNFTEKPSKFQNFVQALRGFSPLADQRCQARKSYDLASILHYRVHSDLPGAEAGGPMDVGLPRRLLLPVLRSIRQSVQDIRDVISAIEMRMVGSSLLIIYEGDWDRAEMGVQWLAEQAANATGGEETNGVGREFEEASDEDEEEYEESDDESDDEHGDYKSPCVVKVIDFAHTRLKPGEGPDQSVLKGLETVLALLDGRIMDCMTS